MEILSKSKLNQLFVQLIRQYFEERGFLFSDKGILIKKMEDGFESIFYEALKPAINAKVRLEYSSSKRIDSIESIWQKYYLILNRVGDSFKASDLPTLIFDAAKIRDYRFETSKRKWFHFIDRYEEDATEEGVRLLASKFIENIDKYVLPTFDKFNSIEAIDKVMNATPETYWECIHLFTGNGLIFKKMIVAKLAGNPNYDAVCESIKQKIMDIEESQDLSRDKYMLVWNELKTELELI